MFFPKIYCSCVLGLFTNDRWFLVIDLFAEANMLYLETPVGVGFSYSTDTSSYESVNDKITGMQLQRFFTPPILQCKRKSCFWSTFGVQSWSSNPLGFYEYPFFPFMMMSDSCTVSYSCCFVLFLFGFDKKRSEAFQTFMHVASPFHASSFSETSLFLSSIARDNVVFLQRWFVKFPQYKKSSLFITGESYAGKSNPISASNIQPIPFCFVQQSWCLWDGT